MPSELTNEVKLDIPLNTQPEEVRSIINAGVQSDVVGILSLLTDAIASVVNLIDINVFISSTSNTNWSTLQANASAVYAFYLESSGVQNDQITFTTYMLSGTWTIQIMHSKNTNRGIMDVQIDGVSVGTIDGYDGAAQENQTGTISGVIVSTSSSKAVKILMSTKNASSSAYIGSINHIRLMKTA